MTFTYCPNCSSHYRARWDEWPKKCHECGEIAWKNPKPVVCVLQPVTYRGTYGLAIARRAIEPKIGSWSLIGGFMETGETMEQGAAREFREETSLGVAGIPRYAFSAHVGPNSEQLMLMTFIDKAMPLEVFEQGRPCPENQELGVMWRDYRSTELAFPTHREAAQRFFDGEFEWHR